MNRNANTSFAYNPTSIDISRSTFYRPSVVKTSFNVGDIIPFYVDDVLPGDTFNIETSKVVRLQTLITPMMDNLYLDTYYFFVPNRLVWSHWINFMGENTESAWMPSTEYEVPQIVSPSNGWNVGTIADYFGIPTGVDNISLSALPFRAYALICDQWFRSENLSDPLNIPMDETTVTGVNTGTFVSDVAKGGLPYKAAKYFDYFTGALPSPQKGPDVPLPLGNVAPVVTSFNENTYSGNQPPLYWRNYDGTTPTKNTYHDLIGLATESGNYWSHADTRSYSQNGVIGVYPTNLITDLQGATGATINQLRLAFQIQKLYEKDSRGGSRYCELIRSHFACSTGDARIQRTEYLGGNRIPIRVNQVVQNSGTISNPESNTESSTPQGNVAGYSLTSDVHKDFIKSFVEHGYVIGVMVARYDHTYQQGIERHWSRKDRFDFYWPVFANIGEQAIKNKEIYAQGSDVVNASTGVAYDEETFGYQEAWAEYRYKPSHVTGEMRSTYATSLDFWHLADEYSSLPTLSDSWIREDKSNVDRVLAVTSSVSNQLMADIYVKNRTTRPMPVYSVPGLIDHH